MFIKQQKVHSAVKSRKNPLIHQNTKLPKTSYIRPKRFDYSFLTNSSSHLGIITDIIQCEHK